MDQEKRMRTRVPVHFDVSILLGEELIRTEIINISLSGILCAFNPLFQNNALCKVIIFLSDDLQIVVDSKISRLGEMESAISFISMDEESFIHLKQLVQYNAGDADIIDKELNKQAFN
ncbi:MAG: PilZ domain-containing protein [Syntrophus sp. (in: bacteria)]